MLFGFTFAEAALAKLLAEGLSLDEPGARLSISRNTVKSRLGATFIKIGVERQSSLVSVQPAARAFCSTCSGRR